MQEILLLKEEKRLLKTLIKSPIHKLDKAYADKTYGVFAVERLSDFGLIKLLADPSFSKEGAYGNKNVILLTSKGASFFKTNWIKIKNFMVRSIIVPAVVSFITALITLGVKMLM